MIKILLSLTLLVTSFAAPLAAQHDAFKAAILKHMNTSRDFTLQVAEAMPAPEYNFKLTAPQMSFGQQMVHLASGLSYFLAPFSGTSPDAGKPASMSKPDVIAFVKTRYDQAINQVSQLTPEQIAKTYKGPDGNLTGMDLLLGMLDHTTHHRASAEMYLRAKDITPPEYQD